MFSKSLDGIFEYILLLKALVLCYLYGYSSSSIFRTPTTEDPVVTTEIAAAARKDPTRRTSSIASDQEDSDVLEEKIRVPQDRASLQGRISKHYLWLLIHLPASTGYSSLMGNMWASGKVTG